MDHTFACGSSTFYLCDAMLMRVYATAFLFVYVSVCLYFTCMLCIKMAKHFVKILLPPDSAIILVFYHQGSLLNSDGLTFNGVLNTRQEGVRKLDDF